MQDGVLGSGRGKRYSQLIISERPAGSLALPVITIEGRKEPTLLVTAGVHPTEYAGIEAALKLARRLKPSDLFGRVVVVPVVNILGFNSRIPGGCPEDSVDIFGAFPGYAGESISYTIAHQLFEKLAKKADFVVDLHGGELNESESINVAWYCKTGNKKVDKSSERLARLFGADYLLDGTRIWIDEQKSRLPRGLLAFEAAKAGVPAIIGEGGGSGKAGEKETERLFDGLVNVCKGIGILNGEPDETPAENVHDLTLLTAKHDGLLYNKVNAGERVKRGQLLAEIRNWRGPLLQKIVAPYEGMITITVDWLPIRSGEYVLAMVRI